MGRTPAPPEGWTCRPVEGDDLAVWEALLSTSPQANPFSTGAWLDAACRLTGGEPLRLLILKGREPVGAAALHVRKGPVGAEVMPPPFGVFHTPCWRAEGNPAAARRGSDALAGSQALAAHLEEHFGASTLRLHPTLIDVRGFQWRDWETRVHYTWQVPLGDAEACRRACTDDVQQSVRKAEKAGVEVALAEDCGSAVDLWLATAMRQKTRTGGSREGLLALFQNLAAAGLLQVWMARSKQGEALAAVWVMEGKGWSGYWLAANGAEALKTGANALLLWRLFEILAPRGGVLDLCGADYPSISHFKAKFGGTLVPCFQVEKALSARARLRGMLSR